MNIEELKEGAEHAHEKGEKTIGLTMAVTAVLLAMVTLLSHRSHTEEVLLQGKIVDDWNFYQAKHGRAYELGALAEIAALLPNGKETAAKDYKKSAEEECGVPVEENCKSPVKASAALQAVMAETSGDSAKPAKPGPSAEHAAAPGHENAGHDAATAPEKSTEKHEPKEAAHKPGAANIQEQAKEREHEQTTIQNQANFYDASELFLEISIVLCSIALLADSRLFWKMSFLTTLGGVAVALWGMFGVH
jgi:hypothetical protein